MKGTVKFISIKHGTKLDLSDLGIFGVSGSHKYLGFKPGRAGKREGWLIVLVNSKRGTRAPRALRG